MRADRLKTLADYLETEVRDDAFNISMYECGTVRCAPGYASIIFPECSLEYLSHRFFNLPHFRHQCYYNSTAASEFFELPMKEVLRVFYGHSSLGYNVSRIAMVEMLRELYMDDDNPETLI